MYNPCCFVYTEYLGIYVSAWTVTPVSSVSVSQMNVTLFLAIITQLVSTSSSTTRKSDDLIVIIPQTSYFSTAMHVVYTP